MEIDIRNNVETQITKIRFAEDDYLEVYESDPSILRIADGCGCETYIYIKDIDNLIKALEKAKEVFGNGVN